MTGVQASAPTSPSSRRSLRNKLRLLLQDFWSGICNNEDSKFSSPIGNAVWETQQMGSNCRPVVGTLLTNTQVAVYRAFWNRMWLGSWGWQSNYQHLSFLFNEGECGKRLCLKQPGWRKMPGLWRHGACTISRWPGSSMFSRGLHSLLPRIQTSLLGERMEFFGSFGINHRSLQKSVVGHTSVPHIKSFFSNCQVDVKLILWENIPCLTCDFLYPLAMMLFNTEIHIPQFHSS